MAAENTVENNMVVLSKRVILFLFKRKNLKFLGIIMIKVGLDNLTLTGDIEMKVNKENHY